MRCLHPMRLRLRALTVVEVLVGLAISVILLASVATAFYAASKSISGTQSSFTAAQSGRVAVSKISNAVRTAHAVQIGAATGVSEGSTGSGTALYVLPTPTTVVAYVYDSAGQRLLYDTDPPTPSDTPDISAMAARMPGSTSTPSVFVLAKNVKRLTFSCVYHGGTASSVNTKIVAADPDDKTTFAYDQAVVPRRAVPPAASPAP